MGNSKMDSSIACFCLIQWLSAVVKYPGEKYTVGPLLLPLLTNCVKMSAFIVNFDLLGGLSVDEWHKETGW